MFVVSFVADDYSICIKATFVFVGFFFVVLMREH